MPRIRPGFSLIELLIVLIVVIVLTVEGVPNFIAMMQRYRLTTNTQMLYYNLQLARSEAIKRNQSVYVTFQTGSSWCYGINNGSACSCATPSGCALGTYTSPNQLTSLSLTSITNLIFEPTRGGSNAAGFVILTVTGGTNSMGVKIGIPGNITLCSDSFSGYSTCT